MSLTQRLGKIAILGQPPRMFHYSPYMQDNVIKIMLQRPINLRKYGYTCYIKLADKYLKFVIPAKAGIQRYYWMPDQVRQDQYRLLSRQVNNPKKQPNNIDNPVKSRHPGESRGPGQS